MNDTKIKLDIVKKARKTIDEIGWTQRAYARHNKSSYVMDDVYNNYYYNGRPDCFCAFGALLDSAEGQNFAITNTIAEDLIELLNIEKTLYTATLHLYNWNDAEDRTKKQVLELFDTYIKKLKFKLNVN